MNWLYKFAIIIIIPNSPAELQYLFRNNLCVKPVQTTNR